MHMRVVKNCFLLQLSHVGITGSMCISVAVYHSQSIRVLCRKEYVQKFIDCQVKDVAEFEVERDELIKVHEDKKLKLKKEYMDLELELEKEFDAALTGLMEKHKPDTFEASSS